MKKITKLLLIVFSGVLLTTGCFKNDTMEDIDIVVTKYPIEYAINELYGDYSTITSIYPNGINTEEYNLTDKKIKEYSKKDLFIYNGLSKENDIAIDFINKNKKLKLIDISNGLEVIDNEEELWFNPSNYLMIAQNIKNDLSSYINSTVILQNINANYEKLKLTISTYDAQLNTIAENANNKNIVVTNNAFKFLERYGFTVYSLDEKNYSSAAYNSALTLAQNKNISYIFSLDGDEETDKVKNLLNLGLTKVTINRLGNLDDVARNNKIDYITIMDSFLENLRQEVYSND